MAQMSTWKLKLQPHGYSINNTNKSILTMFKRNQVPIRLKNIDISFSSLPPCHSEGPRPAAPVLCTSAWPHNLQQVGNGHHHLYTPELTLPVYISPWAAIIRANPKSQSLMTPVLETRMFSGFISRWMICRDQH